MHMELSTVKREAVVTASLTLLSFLIYIIGGRKLSEAILSTARIGFILLITLLLFLAYEKRIKSSTKKQKLKQSIRYHSLFLIISGVWILANLVFEGRRAIPSLEMTVFLAVITIAMLTSPFLLRLLRLDGDQLYEITLKNLIKLILASVILSSLMGE